MIHAKDAYCWRVEDDPSSKDKGLIVMVLVDTSLWVGHCGKGYIKIDRLLTAVPIWTRDKKMAQVAKGLGVGVRAYTSP